MNSFWDATEAFGHLLIAKMDILGLEATMWFWIVLAVCVWMNNVRTWVRTLARKRRDRIRAKVALGIKACAEEKED
jgi:hypothetical protein